MARKNRKTLAELAVIIDGIAYATLFSRKYGEVTIKLSPETLAWPGIGDMVWSATFRRGGPSYVTRVVGLPDGCSRSLYLHRELVKTNKRHPFVDHINIDVTDFRLENLRAVTPRQSVINRRCDHRNNTGHKGIRFLRGQFVACFSPAKYRLTWQGFKSLADAIAWRKQMSEKYYGSYETQRGN